MLSSFNSLLLFTSLLLLSGCSMITNRYGEVCKSRAYTREPLDTYISTEYPSTYQARLGIIPFTVPENMTGIRQNVPPLGAQLAWRFQAELLSSGVIPIAEVTPWNMFPGSRNDFFQGNYKAIRYAADAGYDMVLIGLLEQNGAETATVLAKLIDVNTSVTLWYGRSHVYSRRPSFNLVEQFFVEEEEMPAKLDLFPLYNEVIQCAANNLLRDEAANEREADTTYVKEERGWRWF